MVLPCFGKWGVNGVSLQDQREVSGVARGTFSVTWHLGMPDQCWERTERHKQRGRCPRGEGDPSPQPQAAEVETSTSPSTHQKP